jgi:hypothetical protein
MIDGLDPANARGTPPRSQRPEQGTASDRRRCAVCGIEPIDYRTVAAALKLSNILGIHVAGTCSPIALNALADVQAADGIASADYSNRKHMHTWLVPWRSLALDVDGQGRS